MQLQASNYTQYFFFCRMADVYTRIVFMLVIVFILSNKLDPIIKISSFNLHQNISLKQQQQNDIIHNKEIY